MHPASFVRQDLAPVRREQGVAGQSSKGVHMRKLGLFIFLAVMAIGTAGCCGCDFDPCGDPCDAPAPCDPCGGCGCN